MKRLVLTFLLSTFWMVTPLMSLDWGVVPFYPFTDNPEMELGTWEAGFFSEFAKGVENHPQFKKSPVILFTDVPPSRVRSGLDAQSFCSEKELDVLIFGSLKRGRKSVELEITIFDAKRNDIVRTLFFKEDLGTKAFILEDAVERLYKEIVKLQGQVEGGTALGRPEVLTMTHGLGYWVPWFEWFDQVVPTAYVTSGVNLTFPGDLWRRGNRDIKLQMHFQIGYENGLSKPLQAPYIWNAIDISMGGGVLWTLYDLHGFSVDIGPVYRIALLGYQAPYEDFKIGAYSQWGGSGTLGYSLFLNETRSTGLGVKMGFQCILLEPLMWKSSLGIYGFWGGELK